MLTKQVVTYYRIECDACRAYGPQVTLKRLAWPGAVEEGWAENVYYVAPPQWPELTGLKEHLCPCCQGNNQAPLFNQKEA